MCLLDWCGFMNFFFFSSRRRHTRSLCDWSSDVCSSDLWFSFTVPEGGGRLWFLLPVLLVVGTAVLVALMLVWKMRLIQPVEVSHHNFLLCSKWDRTGLFLISIGARYLYITAGNRNYLKHSFRRSKSITRFN